MRESKIIEKIMRGNAETGIAPQTLNIWQVSRPFTKRFYENTSLPRPFSFA